MKARVKSHIGECYISDNIPSTELPGRGLPIIKVRKDRKIADKTLEGDVERSLLKSKVQVFLLEILWATPSGICFALQHLGNRMVVA